MRRYEVLVVGAGISGLTIASEVGRIANVAVVDRLPAVGGVLGYQDPCVECLERGLRNLGVELMLGTTALRWVGNRLLVAGPRGIEWIAASCLAFCGGTRPSTPAELRLGGDRSAGIFPATVAVHLLEAGVRLGNSVVVTGSSDWSTRAARQLRSQGTRITAVLDNDASEQTVSDDVWRGWTPLEVHGAARVSYVVLGRARFRQRIPCDAVILGGQLKPLRNVDGAVFDSGDVVYVQPVAEVTTAQQVEAYARGAAMLLIAAVGGKR